MHSHVTLHTYFQVPWMTPRRAYLTLPRELALAPSVIPQAGLGVFSLTFIRRYTWLGVGPLGRDRTKAL